jgi:hypothetical protein
MKISTLDRLRDERVILIEMNEIRRGRRRRKNSSEER